MASSPLNLRNSFHVRSNSLPSKSHPLALNIEEHLCRLRSSGAASCSSHNLSSTTSLYDSVEDLLQLSQKTMSGENSSKLVSGVLNGSLRLLDICNSTREIFLQIIESVQDLQLALRRNKVKGLEKDVDLYLIARKKVKKTARKCFSDIKKVMKINEKAPISEKDQHIATAVGVLREVECIALSTFKSLLSSVCSSRLQTTPTSWLFDYKLMQKNSISCVEEAAYINEMENIDIALSTLISKKSSKGMNVENVQKGLEYVWSSIQGMDDDLECIYRSLIKTRVSLLNILSQ